MVQLRYTTDRPVYSQTDFDKEFDRKRRTFPLGQKLRKALRYHKTCMLHTINTNQSVFRGKLHVYVF